MKDLVLWKAALSDAKRVQAILDEAPRYHLNTEGVHPVANSGLETLTTIPPGFDISKKHVFIIQTKEDDIGIFDLLEGFPDSDTAFLGLLLLKENVQGKGFGTKCYERIEEIAKKSGLKKIRLAVVDSNPVEPFWVGLGFSRTGKTAPHEGLKIQSTKRVLEKIL